MQLFFFLNLLKCITSIYSIQHCKIKIIHNKNALSTHILQNYGSDKYYMYDVLVL